MKIETTARQVCIFINSTDQWHGKPLFAAIVQLCEEKQIAGATVFRAAEGFGVNHQLHTRRLLALSENLPVRIDIIDTPEHVDPLLPELEAMIREGLITVGTVHAIQLLPDPAAS